MATTEKVTPKSNNRKTFFKLKFLWIGLAVILGLFIIFYIVVSIYGASTINQDAKRVRTFNETPAKYGLTYQDVSFSSAYSDKLTLRGWWLPNPASKRALVVVHGWNQNRTEMLSMSNQLWQRGFSLLFFDQRGEGASDGERYFYGQYESWDVVGAFNFIKSQGFLPENIGIMARSMGGAASLLAMSHSSEITTLFSDSAWADFNHILELHFSQESGLPTFFLPGILTAARFMYNFNIEETSPVKVLGSLHDRRIYLIHGTKDTWVPISEFYLLREAGGTNIVGSWVVPEAEHCGAIKVNPDEYWQRFDSFFNLK
jgi:uncharacterized protein